MSAAWNTESENVVSERARLTIKGESYDIDPGEDFAQTVLEFAKDEGFSKFRVFVGGEEIQPEDAKESFEPGDNVEIRPYDWAG